jgi:hypothetical protein
MKGGIMIRAIACWSETRSRDKKRKRLLLIIGGKQFHITRNEGKILALDIIRKLK